MARFTRAELEGMGMKDQLPPKKPRLYNNDGKRPKKGPRPDLGRNVLFDEMCKANGLELPVTEYPFAEHIGRDFRADHLFGGWLILEIQGGIYGMGKKCVTCGRRRPGAHSSIERMKSDIERQRVAVECGYVIIECLPEEVADGSIFPIIKRILSGDNNPP